MSESPRHGNLYAPGNPLVWRTRVWVAALLSMACALGGSLCTWALVEGLQRLGAYPAAQWANVAITIGLSFGIAMLLLGGWVRAFERKGLADVGLGAGAAARLARGFLLGTAFLLAVVGLLALSGACAADPGGAFVHLSRTGLLSASVLALAITLQATCEEFVFRGWMMPVIAGRYGRLPAVLGSTAFFTLGHATNIKPSPELALGLANVFLFGLFLALYAIRERSLWGPCGWHAAWNWLLCVGFGLNVSGLDVGMRPFILEMKLNGGDPWWLTGGAFGAEASLVTTAVVLAGIGYAWAVDRWRSSPAHAHPEPSRVLEQPNSNAA